MHGVAVGQRVGQPLEHHDAGAVAADGAAGRGVEGPAVPVGGQDAGLGVLARVHRNVHGGTAGQRQVALTGQQRLRGQVNRHQ